MNDFVDFGKRNVDLPQGCKDLMDVLAANSRSAPRKGRKGVLKLWQKWIPQNGLSHVEKHVEWFWASESRRMLSIFVSEDVIAMNLLHQNGVPTATLVLDGDGTEREALVRKLFREQGIVATRDATVGPAPHVKRVLSYPLALSAENATTLIRAVLQSAFRISDEAGLSFLRGE